VLFSNAADLESAGRGSDVEHESVGHQSGIDLGVDERRACKSSE
jgi:hypothetical protein